MRRFFATLDAFLCAAGHWLVQPLGTRIAVVTLLSIHAGLLAYSATRHSPTHLEPAFLASGISHWELGRFDLYCVNPPIPRMIAALPVLAVGCRTDWSRFSDKPGSRSEHSIGEDFVKTNRSRSVELIVYARWACILYSVFGGYFAYLWAAELYGDGAGLVTLFLWSFEPNLLAHGELVTSDCAGWSSGVIAGYTFWRWLKQPTWGRSILAGAAMALAELTKLTWLILFILWPLIWLFWWAGERWRAISSTYFGAENGPAERNGIHGAGVESLSAPPLRQLSGLLVIAVYLLNAGYTFDGTLTRAKDFQFVSTLFTGLELSGSPGNRFRDSFLGELPIPLPKPYLIGVDVQRKDFEDYGQFSYLQGEWKRNGWWYYYLYGLFIKVPCGLWGVACLVVVNRLRGSLLVSQMRDEMVPVIPAVALFALVSSQTEFNHHLRYVFPSLGLTIVVLGQAASLLRAGNVLVRCSVALFLAHVPFSTLSVYPNHLLHFNEFVGGSVNGWKHLLGSSFDWGQGLLELECFSEAKVVITERDAAMARSLGLSLALPDSADLAAVENGHFVGCLLVSPNAVVSRNQSIAGSDSSRILVDFRMPPTRPVSVRGGCLLYTFSPRQLDEFQSRLLPDFALVREETDSSSRRSYGKCYALAPVTPQ